MLLGRFAVVTLTPDPKIATPQNLARGPVSLQIFGDMASPNQYGVSAVTPLPPGAIVEHRLTIDEIARRQCDETIEATANVMAISGRSTVSVEAMFPCYGLHPETDLERQALESLQNYPKELAFAPEVAPETPALQECFALLGDRPAGASAIAAAFSSRTSLGKYRELVLLFESAFRHKFTELDKPLSKFLDGAQLGYTRNEIRMWTQYRDAASHSVHSPPAVESDVVAFLPRMEQAALDVLFNKSKWSDRASDRRDVWAPHVALRGMGAGLRVIHGKPGSAGIAFFDHFGAWRVAHDGPRLKVPEGWWTPGERIRSGPFSLEVSANTVSASYRPPNVNS